MIAIEKSENHWVLLTITGVVLIILAGFDTSLPPSWLDYLNYGFFIAGIITLLLAVIDFGKRKKV